jgi:hypothetical protein
MSAIVFSPYHLSQLSMFNIAQSQSASFCKLSASDQLSEALTLFSGNMETVVSASYPMPSVMRLNPSTLALLASGTWHPGQGVF